MTGAGGSVGARFASPIDAFTFGEHRSPSASTPLRVVQDFTDRITPDGRADYPAEPGRYHLYGGRFCPRTQRANIVLALTGLAELVSVSYVNGLRDGRGWAFRERTGPDPINGFVLLREAYEATEPNYEGNIAIPVLWDRRSNRIVSNDADTIDVDLATAFAAWVSPGIALYPLAMRERIDDVSRQISVLERTVVRAVYSDTAKDDLRVRLNELNRRLKSSRYLIGDALTLADIRLWVRLVRYDVGINAHGAAGPKLTGFANLWAYARDLYAQPAFRDTTDFGAFAAPLTPFRLIDGRDRRAGSNPA
jgi:glutathionyl-hydroquinone reductase